MALDAAVVMRGLVAKLRANGFNDRTVDVAEQCEDEWDRSFANVELHVEEPPESERRYFDYHSYCKDLCDEVAAEFKKHGRFQIVWGERSLVRVVGAPVKPGTRVLRFTVTPFWVVRVEFSVERKREVRSRASVQA